MNHIKKLHSNPKQSNEPIRSEPQRLTSESGTGGGGGGGGGDYIEVHDSVKRTTTFHLLSSQCVVKERVGEGEWRGDEGKEQDKVKRKRRTRTR